jgi:hypothetical protein
MSTFKDNRQDYPNEEVSRKFTPDDTEDANKALVGKSARNSVAFRNYSDSGPFELQNFSSEFNFSNCKMCSHQFGTQSCQFRILSHHRFFQFHELENLPTFFFEMAATGFE